MFSENLSEDERLDVQQMAADNPAIRTEIAAIEKAVMNLSQSVSPNISSETYDKIRRRIIRQRLGGDSSETKDKLDAILRMGCFFIILVGTGMMYLKMNDSMNEQINSEIEKNKTEYNKMQQTVTSSGTIKPKLAKT